MSRRALVTWIVLCWVFLAAPLFAQSKSLPNMFRSGYQDARLLEGEHIDTRTGLMYWETTDIEIPGNGGLDIIISRSFGKSSAHERNAFANWALEIPRISFVMTYEMYQAKDKGEELCRSMKWYSDGGYPRYGMKSVRFYAPQISPMDVFYRGNNSPYPSRAKFVTAKHWIFECNKTGKNETFIATSPEGIRYYLNVKGTDQHPSTMMGSPAPKSTAAVVFYASKIVDRFGNSITYDYEYTDVTVSGSDNRTMRHYNRKPHPVKISSSDGREVRIYYDGSSLPDYSRPYNLPRIQKIVTGDTTWIYDYKRKGLPGNEYVLSHIKLPDNTRWGIDYTRFDEKLGLNINSVQLP